MKLPVECLVWITPKPGGTRNRIMRCDNRAPFVRSSDYSNARRNCKGSNDARDGSPSSRSALRRHSSSAIIPKPVATPTAGKMIWQPLRFWSGYSDYSKTMRNPKSCNGLGYQHNFNDYSKTMPNMNEDQGLGKRRHFSARALARTPLVFDRRSFLVQFTAVGAGPGCTVSERSRRLVVLLLTKPERFSTQSRQAAKEEKTQIRESHPSRHFTETRSAASGFPANEFLARLFCGLASLRENLWSSNAGRCYSNSLRWERLSGTRWHF